MVQSSKRFLYLSLDIAALNLLPCPRPAQGLGGARDGQACAGTVLRQLPRFGKRLYHDHGVGGHPQGAPTTRFGLRHLVILSSNLSLIFIDILCWLNSFSCSAWSAVLIAMRCCVMRAKHLYWGQATPCLDQALLCINFINLVKYFSVKFNFFNLTV